MKPDGQLEQDSIAECTWEPSIPAAQTAIKSEIESALHRQAHVDARRISVEVIGGNVTLSGKVHNWSERDLATSAAWTTPGVSNVVNKLTISY